MTRIRNTCRNEHGNRHGQGQGSSHGNGNGSRQLYICRMVVFSPYISMDSAENSVPAGTVADPVPFFHGSVSTNVPSYGPVLATVPYIIFKKI
jgi:hypothetical protein